MASLQVISTAIDNAKLYYLAQLEIALQKMDNGIDTLPNLYPLGKLITALEFQLVAQVNDDSTTIIYKCLQNAINGYTGTYAVDPTVVIPWPPDVVYFPRYTGIYPIIVNNTNYTIEIDPEAFNQGYANVLDYGAKGDAEFGINGNVADNSNVFTGTILNGFNSSYVGKAITIDLALDATAGRIVELATTITAVNSTTEVVLATNATIAAVNVGFNVGTDDTAAIQDAFDTDKNVLFPSGYVFKTTRTSVSADYASLNFQSYREIKATGATIIRNCDHIHISAVSIRNATVNGGRWYCPYANLDAHDTGLAKEAFRNNRCTDITFQNLVIDGSPEGGVASTRCVGIVVDNCDIQNTYRDGIYTDYSVKLKYTNNYLSNVKDDAISIHDYGAGDIYSPNGFFVNYTQVRQSDDTTNVTFAVGTWTSNVFVQTGVSPVAFTITCIFSNNVQEVINFPISTATVTVNRYVNNPELFRILSMSVTSFSGSPVYFKGKNRVAIRAELLNAGYVQGGQDSIVSGNTVKQAYEGFSSIGGMGIIITDNAFEDTYHCGIKFHNILGNGSYPLFTDEDYLRNITITDNILRRNQQDTYINGTLYNDRDSLLGDGRGAIMVYTAGSNHEIIFTSDDCKSRNIKVYGNSVYESGTNSYVFNNTVGLALSNNYSENPNLVGGDGDITSGTDIDTIGNTFELTQCDDHQCLHNQAMDYRTTPLQARGVLIVQGTGQTDAWTVNYWTQAGSTNGIYKFGSLSIPYFANLVTDALMIQAILNVSYTSANNYTNTITVPAGRKPLKAGFFYKIAEYYYQAISNNVVMRQSLTQSTEDLPDGIISGFVTTVTGALQVTTSGGSYRYNGVVYTVLTPTVQSISPLTDPDESRYDLVYGDPSPPDIDLVEGTETIEGQNPITPDTPAGTVALAYVLVTDDGITVINLNPVPTPDLPALRLTYETGDPNPIVIDMAGDYPEYGSDPSVVVGIQSGLTVTPNPAYTPAFTYDTDGVLQTISIDTLNNPLLEDIVVQIKP